MFRVPCPVQIGNLPILGEPWEQKEMSNEDVELYEYKRSEFGTSGFENPWQPHHDNLSMNVNRPIHTHKNLCLKNAFRRCCCCCCCRRRRRRRTSTHLSTCV